MGVIWTALSVADVTVIVEVAVSPPDVAVTVADPVLTAVIVPFGFLTLEAKSLTVTTLVSEELQVAVLVTSELFNVAVNPLEIPIAMLKLAGVTDRVEALDPPLSLD